MTARIIDVSPADYHRMPQLSASLAKIMIAQSPAHARLNRGRPPSKNLDRGTIMHRLVLGKGADYEAIDAKDWRTNDAKEKRDKARARGLTPVLTADLCEYQYAAREVREALGKRGYSLTGASELAIGWTQHDVECRAMLDHVWLDRGVILDLKITEDAAPDRVEKTAETLGYAIQYAAYCSAVEALRPDLVGRVDFVFAFCEPEPPYAINLCRPDGAFREIGYRRWRRALRTWGDCLKRDTWPSYGETVNQLSPPSWALAREEYLP